MYRPSESRSESDPVMSLEALLALSEVDRILRESSESEARQSWSPEAQAFEAFVKNDEEMRRPIDEVFLELSITLTNRYHMPVRYWYDFEQDCHSFMVEQGTRSAITRFCPLVIRSIARRDALDLVETWVRNTVSHIRGLSGR